MAEPTPLPVQRLATQTLHHVWSPKLNRPVVFTDRSQLHLWTMLEANPSVSRYCERPTWPADCGPRPAIDFWALRDGRPVWLALGAKTAPVASADAMQATSAEPGEPGGPAVTTVAIEELDRHRIWIQNWLSLLPYLNLKRELQLDSLSPALLAFFAREASFEEAEQHFAQKDPVFVRAAAILELHRGRLFSADLLAGPWGRRTRIVRESNGFEHAP